MSDQCNSFFSHFYQVQENVCQHLQFNSLSLFTIIGIIIIPIGVGLTSAFSLGAPGFQILILLLILNYGKTDASLMNQPMQAALYALKSYKNIKLRQQEDQAAINENLILIMAGMMISGTEIGIHSKQYIPSLFTSILTVISLIFVFLTTNKKIKQYKSVAKEATVQELEVFEQDLLKTDDGVEIDVEKFFKQILNNKNRASFIKILPKELLEYDLTIDEHKVRAKDFLNQNSDVTKTIYEKIKYRPISKVKIVFYILIMVINIGLIWKKETIQQICLKEESNLTIFDNIQEIINHAIINNKQQFIINSILFGIMVLYTKMFSSIRLLIKLYIYSFIFGILLGSIGAVGQIIITKALLSIKELPMSTAEVLMTLPILMFQVTATSTIISLFSGLVHDWIGMGLIFILTLFAQVNITPYLSSKIKPLTAFKAAAIFQSFMLIVFVVLQIVRNIHNPKQLLQLKLKVCRP